MTTDLSNRLSIDARSLATVRKTGCRRFVAMIASGTDPISVLTAAGRPVRADETANAYDFGRRFEEYLLKAHAKGLVRALNRGGSCGPEPEFVNLLGRPAKADRIASLQATAQLFARRREHCSSDLVVVGAVLSMPNFGASSLLLPDALLFRSGSSVPIPVEIKAYEDRGFLTPRDGLDGAIAQCGLYAVALEDNPDFGFGSGGLSNEAIVVFREAGRRWGWASSVDVSRARASARVSLADVPVSDDDFRRDFGVLPDEFGRDLASVSKVPSSYCESCAASCAFFEVCRGERLGDVRVLGDALASIDPVGTVVDLVAGMCSNTGSTRVGSAAQKSLHAAYVEILRMGVRPHA